MAPAHLGDERTIFGHPRVLASLFLTTMWERFSFYGMRAILVLFLTTAPDGVTPPGPGFGYSAGTAAAVYGIYNAFVLCTPPIGGWIADRLSGPRKAVLYGCLVMTVGHFCLAISGFSPAIFWFGLLLICLGSGLFMPTAPAMVSDLYGEHDPRRDAGFSLYYMGVNLGAFAAPLVCGTLETNFNWHWAFGAAGIGMLLGLIQYLWSWRKMGDLGLRVPRPANRALKVKALVAALGLVALAVLLGVIDQVVWGGNIDNVTQVLTIAIVLVPIGYAFVIWRERQTYTAQQRVRIKGFIWIFVAMMMFWMLSDQAGSTLNVFAEQNTDRYIGSYEMPAAFFQSINPIVILIFAPVFAYLWQRLADRAPRTGVKLAISLLGIGLAFMIMVPAAMMAESEELVSLWYLTMTYVIATWAELVLMPPSQSATGKLAPPGMVSQFMALFYLAAGVGDAIGGQLANLLYGANSATFFSVLSTMSIVLGVAFFMFRRTIARQMPGVH